MNKLSKAIESAIEEAKITCTCKIDLDNNISVYAEWTEYQNDNNYDVITVYIYENGIIKFSYQVEETITESY